MAPTIAVALHSLSGFTSILYLPPFYDSEQATRTEKRTLKIKDFRRNRCHFLLHGTANLWFESQHPATGAGVCLDFTGQPSSPNAQSQPSPNVIGLVVPEATATLKVKS